MQVTVYPGEIRGGCAAPSSKSMTQRAYAAALLHKGRTKIFNAGDSNDEAAALSAIQSLGAIVISKTHNSIEIESVGIIPRMDSIDVGESGLAARLFIPIASLADTPLTVKGRGTLLQRPLDEIQKALDALSVKLLNFNGYLPITLHGPIQPTDITVDASGGSQFISGLLFALSYATKQPVTLTVSKLVSKPYIDMTLDMLAQSGRPVSHKNYKQFYINPEQFTHSQKLTLSVEGDWSGAANLLVAGATAVGGHIAVGNLNMNSHQADRAVCDVLKDAGANIIVRDDYISVGPSKLHAFEYDATNSPDLFPILAILAANCLGDSRITGVHRLFNKESNRAESISEMLEAFNVPFSIEDDTLCVEGVQQLRGTVIDSYADHRIAMAAAVGALNASGPVDIQGADAVKKSYPGFFNALSLLGVNTTAG